MDLIRVVLANNSPAMLFGLQQTLKVPGITVVGQASDERTTLRLVPQLKPDVLLLPFEISDMLALELMDKLRPPRRKIRKQKPAFVIFDRPDRPGYIKRSFDGGAISYSSICDCQEEIVRTVRAAACAKRYLSATVSSGFANSQLNQVKLTPRQMEVLLLLACGCENKFIASLLSVRNQSVKNVVSDIFAKQGVTSRTAAAIGALLEGILSLTEIERVRRRLEMLEV